MAAVLEHSQFSFHYLFCRDFIKENALKMSSVRDHVVTGLLGTPVQSSSAKYNSPAVNLSFVKCMLLLTMAQRDVDSTPWYFLRP